MCVNNHLTKYNLNYTEKTGKLKDQYNYLLSNHYFF